MTANRYETPYIHVQLLCANSTSSNTTSMPESTGSAGNQVGLAGKDDYGVNMDGMNGYPGDYGDEQMFKDEEEFQGMDYGLLDDEAKDESNDSGEF